MAKFKLSKEKLKEYHYFIQAVQDMYDDLPDGAYLATMESETREWLKTNKVKANALDFYIKYSPKEIKYEPMD